MSVQAIGWVLDHSPAQGTDRLVLIAIANHAGKDPTGEAWEAWPSVALIQREAGLNRGRTVQDALARLVTGRHLEREVNGSPDERIPRGKRPNLYRIRLEAGVTCGDTRCRWCGVTRDAARGDASRPSGVTFDDVEGCRDASPKPLENRKEEPKREPRDAFDRFWEIYPRRDDKGRARLAFGASCSKASVEVILAGAERYRDDPNREARYTKLPATWLRAESWANGPLPARNSPPARSGVQTVIEDRGGQSGRLNL